MNRFWRAVFWLVLILSIFPLYTRYKAAAAPIPPGVHLGGVELSRLKEPDQVQAALWERFDEPIAVYFGDERLILRPEDVDFQLDVERMLAEAQQYLEGPDFLDIAARKLLGLPQQRRDVPLRYRYSQEKLLAWLEQVAETYNHPPLPARALPPQWEWAPEETNANAHIGYVGTVRRDWQWTPGAPGETLLLSESAAAVLAALADPENRTAHLVLEETPPPPLSMADLARALDSFTADFPGFAAIYVQDLTTGEEATVDVDVAFSGMSTMKVAIVTTLFTRMDGVEDVEIGQLIDYALGESNNTAANGVLRRVGDGDIFLGARRVTEFMRSLGFTNSFVQTGYDYKSPVPPIPTAANQRTDWNTNPDSHLQSTPADMGRLLAEIYRCTLGTGELLAIYGEALTPEECRTVLFYMSHDEFRELIWGGLPRPDRAWLVHKHGFVNEAHSDLALIWGPAGPYVIAVYLWRPGWMDWITSNSTMQALSRIAWSFFAYKAQVENIEPEPPPVLEAPAHYIPVASYTSRAATGQ